MTANTEAEFNTILSDYFASLGFRCRQDDGWNKLSLRHKKTHLQWIFWVRYVEFKIGGVDLSYFLSKSLTRSKVSPEKINSFRLKANEKNEKMGFESMGITEDRQVFLKFSVSAVQPDPVVMDFMLKRSSRFFNDEIIGILKESLEKESFFSDSAERKNEDEEHQ